MRPSLPFPVSSLSLCFFLHLLVALRLRSLRFHSPRLCRVAVFLIQTNVSLIIFFSDYGQAPDTEVYVLGVARPDSGNGRRCIDIHIYICVCVCVYVYMYTYIL